MFETMIRRGLVRFAMLESKVILREVYQKKTREVSKARSFLGVLLSLLMLSGSVPAQSATSSVSGLIVDPEGKAVATEATLTPLPRTRSSAWGTMFG